LKRYALEVVKNMKTFPLLLIASLFHTGVAMAQISLSRDEAARQISFVLASDKYQVAKTFTLEATGTTRNFVQPQDRQEHSNKIKGLLTGSDQDFQQAIGNMNKILGAYFTISYKGGITNLRDTWKSGLLDHFEINYGLGDPYGSPPVLDPGMKVFVEGIVKVKFKLLCPPAAGGDTGANHPGIGSGIFCEMFVAQRKIEKVTGITSAFDQGQMVNVVEFDERLEPTDAGRDVGMKLEVRPARALFVLYDDGWRIAQILD
jgi:hypothetical protein